MSSSNGTMAQAILPARCIVLLVITLQGPRGVVMAYGDVHEKSLIHSPFARPHIPFTQAFLQHCPTLSKASALNRGRLWRE